MRYTRLLLIIVVGLALVTGCNGQQSTKQDSKVANKSANTAIDFKPLQLNDNPSDLCWVDTFITYAGYAYTSHSGSETDVIRYPAQDGYDRKLLNPAQVDYVGQYGDTQFYVSKDETQTPPLWLWATIKTLDTDGVKVGFKRWIKIPQGKSQMLRSVASNSKFRLTFIMPKQSYTTGRQYIMHTLLIPTRSGGLLSLEGPLLEVVVLDSSGNVVASQHSSLGQPAARVWSVVSVNAGPPVEHTYDKVSIEFNKPGTYRVICRTTEAAVQKGMDPTIRDALRDLATEPIEIAVK